MLKTTAIVLGTMMMLGGTAFAAPAPNIATGVGEGGGVYYRRDMPPRHPAQTQQRLSQRHEEIGTTTEGGGVYHVPANQQG